LELSIHGFAFASKFTGMGVYGVEPVAT
jgi:hypothetical protein